MKTYSHSLATARQTAKQEAQLLEVWGMAVFQSSRDTKLWCGVWRKSSPEASNILQIEKGEKQYFDSSFLQ